MAVKSSSPILRELASRLRTLRLERHQTQQEVYDVTGVHVGRIEANEVNLTVTTLAALCLHYKVTLATVVDKLEELAVPAGNEPT